MRSVCKWNPFRRLSKWVACCCIVLWGIGACNSQPTYQWHDPQTKEGLVCRQCEPGKFVEKHCTKHTPTVCKPCPGLYYTHFWNYLEKCLYCSVFCNSLEEEVQACNGTHNRACQCKPGYHSVSDFCVPHSRCPVGTGVTQPGNPLEDTKCAPCPEGTFSSSSSTNPCQPHQNCSEQGLAVNVPGDQFHDTFCTACRPNKPVGIVIRTDELSETEGCEEAVIDYIPYQIKAPRRLRRLRQRLSKSLLPTASHRKSVNQLQVELHSYLIQEKNTKGARDVAKKLMGALRDMKLQHILEKMQKHFLGL
uniref:TNF receptor superfamily member 6b n=2 Tax=Salvator merianae TaxID=96440 RepID=A0A8D0E349_SALMN